MEPDVRKLGSLLQLSYNLPYRIHTAIQYPIPAPNGSAVIVYGREGGLSLIWRGGRPWKRIREDKSRLNESSKANGIHHEAIISLDSDSDSDNPSTDPVQPDLDASLFEEEQTEQDSLKPYDTIIQTLDLPLGTDVLHLSFPHLRSDLKAGNLGSLPVIFLERLVMVVACVDCTVRLFTIPLMPPTSKSVARSGANSVLTRPSIGSGLFREQMLILDNANRHQTIPAGVSITFTAHEIDPSENMSVEIARDQTRIASAQTKDSTRNEQRKGNTEWDLLIASHSIDLSGLLIINRVPLMADGSGIDIQGLNSDAPWRAQYLASAAVSIQFNPSLYPDPRHSQLLLADISGVVRIYDCQVREGYHRGSWLVSLYANEKLSGNRVIASQWVLGGKAIAALMTDGEWGMWKLEDSVPQMEDDGTPWHSATGVDLSKFTIGDRINSSSAHRDFASHVGGRENQAHLAPMTASTRKVRQETLFTGSMAKAARPARGGVSMSPRLEASSIQPDDESLLFWYEDTIILISSLLGYWRMKTRGTGGLFGTNVEGQVKQLENVHLGGERKNHVTLTPPQPPGLTRNQTERNSSESSILISAEHRLILIVAPLVESSIGPTYKPPTRSDVEDRTLVARAELDLKGIENTLDKMADGRRSSGPLKIRSRERVNGP